MGCDGGTIPKRHELVKAPKKVEKVDKNAELAAKWKYCALSQEKLRRPIVSCELGRLYNKDTIIEYLLDKSAERPNAEAVAHIRGIKDIKELNLTDNPEWEGERRNSKGDRYEDIHCGMFICPVVGLEMNGKHRFCYLKSCGCVFSDRAMKEVKTEICHKMTHNLHKWMQQGGAHYKMVMKAASQLWPDPPDPPAPLKAPSLRQPLPPPRGPSRTWRRGRRPSNPCSPPTALPSAPKSRHPTGSPTPRITSSNLSLGAKITIFRLL
ncbi:replication termination factor 2 isoform X2 [Siniperca chuatsi]|uniref:replication termination factor 2 isoform X2 n=1 Tax=Siniperca chuatsi TaxID=119488 RepID=UPI001CE0A586|nr:replication termination factor 2 isoform X2 [Siniperca chuatsi]